MCGPLSWVRDGFNEAMELVSCLQLQSPINIRRVLAVISGQFEANGVPSGDIDHYLSLKSRLVSGAHSGLGRKGNILCL